MKRRIATVFVMLHIIILCLTAQPPDYHVRFSARIVADDSVATPLRDCHILNRSLHLGTVSNNYGEFTITANLGDSLVFSILGYEGFTITAADSMYANNKIIRLKPRVYDLPEVNIGRWPNYASFEGEFLKHELFQAPNNIKPITKYQITPRYHEPGFNLVPFYVSPVTAIYNWLSREGRQNRYFQKLLDGTAEHLLIGDKFNGELVNELTGLENDELVQFMSDCNFSKQYLLYAPQDEINREIRRKFKEYKATKSQKL